MIHVTKATGEKEVFDEKKLQYSIHRAGIPADVQEQVLSHVKGKLYDDIPTAEVYHHVIEFLDKTKKNFQHARYSLKQAIMALGPSGYPFEDFIAEILKAQGYTTETRTVLQGACVTHEVDVIAQSAAPHAKRIMVEAKFHNGAGTRTDVQDTLYTKARFDDVKEKNTLNEAWLVTNTKATIDAINYGACVGMQVIGWNSPEGGSLRDIIERYNLHPLTALTTLPQTHQKKLLEDHIVLCKQIEENPKVLDILELSEQQKKDILHEVHFILTLQV